MDEIVRDRNGFELRLGDQVEHPENGWAGVLLTLQPGRCTVDRRSDAEVEWALEAVPEQLVFVSRNS